MIHKTLQSRGEKTTTTKKNRKNKSEIGMTTPHNCNRAVYKKNKNKNTHREIHKSSCYCAYKHTCPPQGTNAIKTKLKRKKK